MSAWTLGRRDIVVPEIGPAALIVDLILSAETGVTPSPATFKKQPRVDQLSLAMISQ